MHIIVNTVRKGITKTVVPVTVIITVSNPVPCPPIPIPISYANQKYLKPLELYVCHLSALTNIVKRSAVQDQDEQE